MSPRVPIPPPEGQSQAEQAPHGYCPYMTVSGLVPEALPAGLQAPGGGPQATIKAVANPVACMGPLCQLWDHHADMCKLGHNTLLAELVDVLTPPQEGMVANLQALVVEARQLNVTQARIATALEVLVDNLVDPAGCPARAIKHAPKTPTACQTMICTRCTKYGFGLNVAGGRR